MKHMAKFVFLNVPAYGHVNPTLPIVQELVRRGHSVSYYLTEDFRDLVEATGATLQPYESKMSGLQMPAMGGATSSDSATRERMARMPMIMMEERESVAQQILERVRAEQADVIVYDMMSAWGKKIVEELQIPAVNTRATYASNDHFNIMEAIKQQVQNFPEMRERMEMLTKSGTQVSMQIFNMFAGNAESLNIVFMPRSFQPAGETFDERYLFVGPSISARHAESDFPFDKLDRGRPLLYISLGSIFASQPEFFKLCFEAFADQPWQVVLAVGRKFDVATLGVVPENFLLAPYVPQLELLPHTSLFVTHAGTNSVMESMYYGVPMVLIPQQPEQGLHARRVEEMGLGLVLDKGKLSAATLRETVERVAQDAGYRERSQQMQQEIRQSGGYQQAADALIQYAQERVKS
jgi:MGT family glycosyltransferase